jgi:hypothetical protein
MGDLRFCLGYRKRNNIMKKKPVTHCPGLRTLWTGWLETNGSPSLEMKGGYRQVDLHPSDYFLYG